MEKITLLFVGIAMMVFGSLIIVFDYPQIQYLESKEQKFNTLPNTQEQSIHQRLIIELLVGIGIVISGIIISSIVGFENRFRQR